MKDNGLQKVADSKGKRHAKAMAAAYERLIEAEELLVEYRSAGYVTRNLRTGKHTLHLVAGTDGPAKSWRIAAKIDVSDQFSA